VEEFIMKNEATLVFGGDFCPIRNYEKKIINGKPIFDEILLEVFNNCDFCMVNQEAPLCEPSLKTADPSGYGLRATPNVATMLKKNGIDAVGLANNHLRDFWDEGVVQTIKNLKQANIIHTGAGKNLEEAQQALNIEINGLKIKIWALAEKEHNVATEQSPGTSLFQPELNVLQIPKYKKDVDLLIIYVHAGHEFTDTPSPRIRDAYRSFIDAGADAVIGHHPHVPQGLEKYQDGVICYSLGNLVFDSDYVSKFDNTDIGFLLKLKVNKKGIADFSTIPYSLDCDYCVRVKTGKDKIIFDEYLKQISRPLNDDDAFRKGWERNVKKRWNEHLKYSIENLSNNLKDTSNLTFFRFAKNLFNCPTHQEMFSTVFQLIIERKIE
jgi:poly-gamma-glutamate synthesis protein (capsule biosynthesis protein)